MTQCDCGNHAFTLPALSFIRIASDGQPYIITPEF